MQPPWAPHVTQYVLRMDFAPSSRLAKTASGQKKGFRLSKGRKKPSCACAISFPVFSKCHAVLAKAPQLLSKWLSFKLREGSRTGTTGGGATLKSKRKLLHSTKKKNKFPPLSHLWSYQLKSVRIGPEGAWASRAERKKPLSFKLLTFGSHCTVYSSIRAGSVCLLGGIRVNSIPCGASGKQKPWVEATPPALNKQRPQERQIEEEEGALVMNN